MEKDFNNDNSKKLITGVSILFCTVILIIGGTIAFFTQSDSESTGNIVSTDKVTLDYQDNDNYMLGDLIPIDEEYLDDAYNNKCKDNLGYNVCSIYQFTITNTGNVVQDIIINMHPKVNGFTNLKFNLYDITNNEQIVFNQELKLNSEEPINLENDLTLDTNNNKSNTYEILFYIKNDPNNDQSHLDAGVRFGANIEVNSVTTGTYLLKDLGDPGCWKADENDSSIISEFIGYKDNNGNEKFDETDELKKECELYFKKNGEYYETTIPSSYAGYNFTTVGNNLFKALNIEIIEGQDEPNFSLNEYSKINNIVISEGITSIEDGDIDMMTGTFFGIGIDDFQSLQTHNVNVTLPPTLQIIGVNSFFSVQMNSITIPASVTEIRDYAFQSCFNLNKLTFEGADNDTSNLLSIGEYAFNNHDLNYKKGIDEPLLLPSSLTTIGQLAFRKGDCNTATDLEHIKYLGNSASILNNNGHTGNCDAGPGWYETRTTTLLTE